MVKNLEKIDDIILERKEQYLAQLFILLKQKSISTQNDGIVECAELLKGLMEEIGIQTRLIETDGNPVVYGELLKNENAFTVLVYGHYDVQPADPIDEWLSPPFEPTIRDGKIFCRGAGDNKGQLMAQVLAIKTYLDAYGELPINVKFVFEGEEEKSSVNLPSFVQENKELLKADLVYTSDGPSHESGNPLILLGVRGNLKVQLTASGADWDNHSGNKGNVVPNPVWKLIALFNTLRDENEHVLIEGFYDNILQPTEHEIQLLKKIPYNRDDIANKIGYKDLALDGETYYRRLMFEPTFNISGFQSGYGGEGVKTIIPAKATAKMDIRLVLDQDPEDIYQKFVRHVNKHAPDIDVAFMGAVYPSRTSPNHELVKIVTSAVREAYQQDPIIQPSLGGSLPDYVWTKLLGLPSVVVPYANFDEANHSPNENLNIDNFFNGIRCTCHVIHMLGKHVKT
ncbi:M20/M25/M40 family metallo-hydrolase [uncultured Brevibacillus sp.]|uniref:M20/M25/M40 family metallo-hydrolase n=1 Tax=uncultured Brevibacillus sp. TaxID=169970 RepID=UPI00259466DF|nr:M20/M25/M40 family metallo-hydrolase [uncultured Brevibacillus sp.]